MIESILVLCTSKEDRQCWIELLIQEQASSSLVKSSTTSRVSCSLPPYTCLSRYFATLVKRKVIRAELLKKLLYVQYVLKPDLTNVKMRKSNVTTYTLYPMQVSDRCRSNDSDTTSSFELKETVDNQRYPEKVTLRKSTVTLEVKYALGDVDLSTVGITNSSSLTELASECNSTRESSISLPVTVFTCTATQPDTVTLVDNTSNIAGCESRFTDILPLSLSDARDLYRKRSGKVNRRLADATFAINCSNNAALGREQSIADISINRSIIQTCNRNRGYQCLTSVRRKFDTERDIRGASSIHSSDSGMVECYRINSSEVNSCKSYTCIGDKCNIGVAGRHSFDESENDENKFEHQCICTSPFDSTPRGSAHLSDLSRNADNTTSSSSISKLSSQPLYGNNEMQVGGNANTADKIEHLMPKRFTQPIPYPHRTITRKVGRKPVQPKAQHDYGEPSRVYTSGLYAHWWLKKSIPFSGSTDQGKLPWHGCFLFRSVNIFTRFSY